MTTFYCTTAQAVALIKRQPDGTSFSMMMSRDAPIPGTTQVFPAGLMTCLTVTRPQAIKLAQDLLHKVLEDKGARLPITVEEADDQFTRRNVTLAYAKD